ncbi:MAG TPA: NADH-quinone oxidoreductase subunit NuoH [Thermoanaerobaculia bacterium]
MDSTSILYVIVIPAIKAVVYCTLMAITAGILTIIERRTLGFMQVRKGPNRVGWEGSLQWVADTIKLMFKEDVVPSRSDRFIHFLAPALLATPALAVFALLPFGPEVSFPVPGLGTVTTPLYAADVNVALLLVLAITTIGIYGVILAGWASNSKYALMGGLRSAAQLISYEVPMGFAVVSVVLMANTLSLRGIIEAQREAHVWFIFPGLVAFFIYFVSGVAETNRIPFDLPEAESELVAGFHTEYSGMKWSFFFMAEYANMVTISAIATTLFFGGWLPPFPNVRWLSFLGLLPPAFWFLGKVFFFLMVYIWLRATFPRYRFDQLMALGWKTLIPLSIGNLVLIALFALWGQPGIQLLGLLLTITVGAGLAVVFRRTPGPRSSETMAAPAEVRS